MSPIFQVQYVNVLMRGAAEVMLGPQGPAPKGSKAGLVYRRHDSCVCRRHDSCVGDMTHVYVGDMTHV
jgi:hypothetical protein